MSMMVVEKVETDQRMARLEQAMIDYRKPLITPKLAVLQPVADKK